MKEWRYPPMLLTKTDRLPEGSEWSFEPKLDGFRMMGEVALAQTILMPRRSQDSRLYTRRYATVTRTLPEAFGGHHLVVDGEMVGFDDEWNFDFGALHNASPNVIYHVFDLLEIDGQDITDLPLPERRQRLHDAYAFTADDPHPYVRLVDFYGHDDRDTILAAVLAMNWEGVIAKKLDSVYRPGRRTQKWLKYVINPHHGWRH